MTVVNTNQPEWRKNLGEVLKRKTQEIKKVSERTGATYTIDVVPSVAARSLGTVEKRVNQEKKIKYRYPIVDMDTNLQYTITANQLVEVRFGTPLIFKNVRGGQIGTSSRGWYSAESVEKGKEN